MNFNFKEYQAIEEEVDALYSALETARTFSEAEGIQRKIDILENRLSRLLPTNENELYTEEEDEY